MNTKVYKSQRKKYGVNVVPKYAHQNMPTGCETTITK